DLPEVSVGIAEVAGVDAPGTLMRRGHPRARRRSLFEGPVDVRPALDELTEAELAALRRSGRHPRVLGELPAGVEGGPQAAVEAEDDDRTRSPRLTVEQVCRDDTRGGQPEAVAIEGERSLEVLHGERDHVDARLHLSRCLSRGVEPRNVPRVVTTAARC